MPGVDSLVDALLAFDDGSGEHLYAAGYFQRAGSIPVKRIARWDGAGWSDVGGGLGGSCTTMIGFDTGNGTELIVGGYFTLAGGNPVSNIASWDGSSWSALGNGLSGGSVQSLCAFDDGGGTDLYAGGSFDNSGGVPRWSIARWDGATWSSVGGGIDGTVEDMIVFDDGSGPALFVGGSFRRAGSVWVSDIAKWDGASWSGVGQGFADTCNALAVFDDGNGPQLYAATEDERIMRWAGAGTYWVNIANTYGPVKALRVANLGSPRLIAGGDFSLLNGVPMLGIAQWDGSGWSSFTTDDLRTVRDMATLDDGAGTTLFVAGSIPSSVGKWNHIVRWDAGQWSSVGTGLDDAVHSVVRLDEGAGPALYANGTFKTAGGLPGRRVHPGHDGCPRQQDRALGRRELDGPRRGTSGSISALASFDLGEGRALFAGGAFVAAPDSGDSHLAQWRCPDALAPVLECPGSVLAFDSFAGPAGTVVTFTVSAFDAQDPTPLVVCTPPSGSYFPRGTTIVRCTATDASGNRSTCEFPVRVTVKTRP